MAKKSRISAVTEQEDIRDVLSTGILQSFVFHIITIFLLALLIIQPEQNKIKPIVITITSFQEEPEQLGMESSAIGDVLVDNIDSGSKGTPEITIDVDIDSSIEEPSIEEVVQTLETSPAEPTEEISEKELMEPLDIKENEENEHIVKEEKQEPVVAEKPKVVQKNKKNTNTANNNNNNNKPVSEIIRGLGLGQNVGGPGQGDFGEGMGMGGVGVGGNGDDFDKRLAEAGAKTGDIQISIAWDNVNDIDVGVFIRNNMGIAKINYQNRMGPNMGMLDVDMNVLPRTNRAVENIFWPKGAAPNGRYTVYVHHYKQWCQAARTPVRVRIKIDGKVVDKQIIISPMDGMIPIFEFDYQQNQRMGPHLSAGHF